MRHTFSRLALAATLAIQVLMLAAPARAQNSDTAEIQALQARIGEHLKYLTSTEEMVYFEFGGTPFSLPEGLHAYADVWRDAFNAWVDNGARLRNYSTGTDRDDDYGYGVDSWMTACQNNIDLIKGYAGIAAAYVSMAGTPSATPEIRERIKANMAGLVRETESLITNVQDGAHALCMRAIADMHFAFMTPHGAVCLANRMSKPSEEPDGGTGTCRNNAQQQEIRLFTLPNCTENCVAKIFVRTGGEDIWQDYTLYRLILNPLYSQRQENLATAKTALEEVTAAIGAETQQRVENAQAAAEAARRGSAAGLPLPLGNLDVPTLIGRIIRQILSVVGALALLMFIWGGFNWMIARGDPKKIQTAKDTLIWSTLGIFVIFAAYGIVGFILDAISK